MFPVDHALDYGLHLVLSVVILLLVEILDQAQEFFHFVDLLDALNEEMLGNLAELRQVFPLG